MSASSASGYFKNAIQTPNDGHHSFMSIKIDHNWHFFYPHSPKNVSKQQTPEGFNL
jgi:hypothetical protein